MTGDHPEAAPLVECVPNVSEGRDAAVVERCRAALAGVAGVHVLHVDRGVDAHRTVLTAVGPPEAIGDAAIRLAHVVAQTIDMRHHVGAHPRIGALDVCPFVPVHDVTLERCAALARRVASTLAHDLDLPVYLYEAAAFRDDRRSLSGLRAGGYEGLDSRLRQNAGAPDFGPARRSERLGATVVGARPYLIAWNASLATDDVRVAERIAGRLRTSGQAHKAVDGTIVRTPGRLTALRAVGWAMPGYGCVQVSCNLLDFRTTPLEVVFEAIREEAEREGVTVLGSELVGLVPLEALAGTGRALGGGPDATAAVATAARVLGLDLHAPFDPAERVLEWRLASALGEGHATIAP